LRTRLATGMPFREVLSYVVPDCYRSGTERRLAVAAEINRSSNARNCRETQASAEAVNYAAMQGPLRAQGFQPPAADQIDEMTARSPAERLREYLRVARRRWIVLVAVTGIVAVVALLISLAGTKKYDATAVLLLREVEPVNSILGNSSSVSDPERESNTQIGLIKLDAVAEGVKEQLHLKTSASELLEQVTTEFQGNSDLVSVTVRDESPRLAAAIANGFATQYVFFRRDTARASLEEAATLARNRLESLSPEDLASTEGRQLEARLRELEIASSLQTGGVEVVRRASVPVSPAVPKPLLSTFIGLLVGFVLAVLIVILLEFADRRLKDEDEAQAIFELPLLARIPRPIRRGDAGAARGDRLREEAFASLAANLLFLDRGNQGSALMVTSPGAADGKTTVTLGLARALATLSKRVIAVEADLRQPRFAERLRLNREPGFAEVAVGAVNLGDALIGIDAETMTSRTSDSVGPSFAVLQAGPPLAAPQMVLSQPTTGEILAECRARADFVLVDVPPIGVVHDAITLANFVDGVMLVSRLNWTTKDVARESLRILRQLNLDVLGLVLTGTDRSENYYHREAAAQRRQTRVRTGIN
jgi:Mrp family chromosome partitioning ATPase